MKKEKYRKNTYILNPIVFEGQGSGSNQEDKNGTVEDNEDEPKRCFYSDDIEEPFLMNPFFPNYKEPLVHGNVPWMLKVLNRTRHPDQEPFQNLFL